MGGLIWRVAPYLARLFWPGLIGTGLAVLGVVALGEGRSGDPDRLLSLCAVVAAAIGVLACILWAALSIRAYRRSDTPPPPL